MNSLYIETPAHATHFRIIFPFSPSDISLFPFGAVCGKIPAETFSKEEYPLSAIAEILEELKKTPVPEGVGYVPEEEAMQELPAATEVSEYLYGGMPVQMGWCNGHNTKLNCLEYHRDSEFNLGTSDFILLLAKQDEIENGVLDTAKVKTIITDCEEIIVAAAKDFFPGAVHIIPVELWFRLVTV